MTLKALLKVIPAPEEFQIVFMVYGTIVRTLENKSADDLREYRTLPVTEIQPGTIYIDMGVKLDGAHK